jgi:hypothetical protein
LSVLTVVNVTRPASPRWSHLAATSAAVRLALGIAQAVAALAFHASELQQLEATIQGLEPQRALLGEAIADAAPAPPRDRLATNKPSGAGEGNRTPV